MKQHKIEYYEFTLKEFRFDADHLQRMYRRVSGLIRSDEILDGFDYYFGWDLRSLTKSSLYDIDPFDGSVDTRTGHMSCLTETQLKSFPLWGVPSPVRTRGRPLTRTPRELVRWSNRTKIELYSRQSNAFITLHMGDKGKIWKHGHSKLFVRTSRNTCVSRIRVCGKYKHFHSLSSVFDLFVYCHFRDEKTKRICRDAYYDQCRRGYCLGTPVNKNHRTFEDAAKFIWDLKGQVLPRTFQSDGKTFTFYLLGLFDIYAWKTKKDSKFEVVIEYVELEGYLGDEKDGKSYLFNGTSHKKYREKRSICIKFNLFNWKDLLKAVSEEEFKVLVDSGVNPIYEKFSDQMYWEEGESRYVFERDFQSVFGEQEEKKKM